MTILDDIRYVAVRINCSSENGGEKQGTGTLIKDGGRCFVMTAAHCLKGKDKRKFDRQDIRISIVLGKDDEVAIEVVDVVEYCDEENKDWALVEVKGPDVDFQYERVRRCYNAADNHKEEFYFYGFTEMEPEGALYKVENRSMAGGYWHLKDIPIDGQVDNAHKLIDGNSGAGVFFVHGEIVYFVGYVKALINKNGAYSDFVMLNFPQTQTKLTDDSVRNITLDVLKYWIREISKNESEKAKSRLGEEKPVFLANLDRKMTVICADDEDRERLSDSHIASYIEGSEIMLGLLNKGNTLYEELNEEDAELVKEINKGRKTKFATEDSAEKDLDNVKDRYSKYAEKKFRYDNEQKTVANKYTAFRVAEKLMDCSIDYKKK